MPNRIPTAASARASPSRCRSRATAPRASPSRSPPARPKYHLKPRASRQSRRSPDNRPSWRRKRRSMARDILIIDDEDDIRDLIAGILEDEGYETRQAHDAD